MNIVEYTPDYENDVKDLLTQLQTFLSNIDPQGIIVVRENYRDGYFAHAMTAVKNMRVRFFLPRRTTRPSGSQSV